MRSQDSVPSELKPLPQNPTLAVIGLGLGYLGLPLAVEFGKKFRTIGSDLSQHKIDALDGHCISVDPCYLTRRTGAMLLAVSHRQYLQTPIADILAHLKPGRVFTDIKSAFDPEAIRQAGFIPSRP